MALALPGPELIRLNLLSSLHQSRQGSALVVKALANAPSTSIRMPTGGQNVWSRKQPRNCKRRS
jgi:hypothetical protein